MADNQHPQDPVDLPTVEAELHPHLATIDWTRARLDEFKAEVAWWIGADPDLPDPDLPSHPQHDSADDALDEAIVAEHTRVEEATSPEVTGT